MTAEGVAWNICSGCHLDNVRCFAEREVVDRDLPRCSTLQEWLAQISKIQLCGCGVSFHELCLVSEQPFCKAILKELLDLFQRWRCECCVLNYRLKSDLHNRPL